MRQRRIADDRDQIRGYLSWPSLSVVAKDVPESSVRPRTPGPIPGHAD